MRVFSVIIGRIFLAGLLLSLSGCLPSPDSPLDEQKDPYFLAGKKHVSTLNYRAAVDAFEKALESNPRSASSHLELGLLYEQKISEENSHAIAIYHFNKYLELRPKSEHAEIVRQKILTCKQEIAKPIALAPGTQSVLRDLERLKIENAQYKSQLEAWQAFGARQQTSSAAIPAVPAVLPPRPVPATPPPAPAPGATVQVAPGPVPAPPGTARAPAPAPVAAPAAKTYEVKMNDTMSSIAKRNHVSPNALSSANPGVNPKHLKIGQVLNIPAQ
jgi:nucleoid-associated protein YgaU